jgi:hypothetical protein
MMGGQIDLGCHKEMRPILPDITLHAFLHETPLYIGFIHLRFYNWRVTFQTHW